ncbi:hypothetical protein [Siminovitchia sp. FSL W7-1587]|uniref:hypothetical protein n=1 Tax=Siminovitchia sp. FSL W7-1587 TaxID=2954699 RepID=UPI0030D4CB13
MLAAFAEAGSWGWLDKRTISMVLAEVILLVLCVKRELGLEFPLLNFSVLAHQRFTYSITLNVVLSIALYSGAFLMQSCEGDCKLDCMMLEHL